MQQNTRRSFRLTCPAAQTTLVEELLCAQGFVFEADPVHPAARAFLHTPLAPGASLAALFGFIYMQDRSSMLPPIALATEQGDCVLDLCAGPGGKSGMLALAAGRTGFVAANEPAPKRSAVLRANLSAHNMLCCVTVSCPGERFPRPEGGFLRILLDPPCSGWGTAAKHPGIKDLWRGDKIRPLITLQRKLLTRAAELLSPGGRLVYSTCTTNREENEAQIRFACDELGLEFLPPDFYPPAFALEEPDLPCFAGVWKVRAPQAEDPGLGGQGFFVARLGKKGGTTKEDPPAARTPADNAGNRQSGGDACRNPAAQTLREDTGGGGAGPSTGAPPRGTRAVPLSFLAGPYVDPSLLPPGQVLLSAGDLFFLPESGAKLPEHFKIDNTRAARTQSAAGRPEGAGDTALRRQAPKGASRNQIAVRTGTPPGLRAFPLGRVGADGAAHVNPRLRSLMPAPADLARSSLPHLSVDEAEPLLALVSGQGLRVDADLKETGLYFRDLPLCRLTVKGGRALLPRASR
ncbi:MAG: RsmB/NOP family class I SAM-dependent RNA methyltransferase [Desulfovibrio sp.]|nr:RsmB/NOP family class I SAM-dependent RNA methyltransferase [Desulfovibrio sp.]